MSEICFNTVEPAKTLHTYETQNAEKCPVGQNDNKGFV